MQIKKQKGKKQLQGQRTLCTASVLRGDTGDHIKCNFRPARLEKVSMANPYNIRRAT